MATFIEGGETVTRAGDRATSPIATTAGLLLLYAAEHETFPGVIPLTAPHLIVGRSPPPGGCALPQEATSRMHARFTLREGVWHVADLNSRNGTKVDGRRVVEAPLAPGAVVQIGDTLLAFVATEIERYRGHRLDSPPPPGFPELIGGMHMKALAAEVSRFAPSPLSVLVVGETGTGKELVAHAIHRQSRRAGRTVVVRCTGERIEEALAQRGDHDTLLLDEIADLCADDQARLLHALATTPGLRVVSTTQHDLSARIADGRFRADLFARISGCQLRLPALRERKEDLFALVRHIAPGVDVTFDFMSALCLHRWPFNVRELENVVRWSLSSLVERRLTKVPPSLDAPLAAPAAAAPPVAAEPAAPKALDPEHARALLRKYAGNVSAVARELGKDRAQIHRWLREQGIRPDDYRDS